MNAPSYTHEHPVRTLACTTCQMSLGGEGVTELLEQLFRSVHAGHQIEEDVPAQ